MSKEKNSWKIECDHTPETIDRILMPIRKRGLKVTSLNYLQIDSKNASCTIEFELDPIEAAKVYKNMLRIHDIQTVNIL
jgi:acetolactate synthase II small subunit